MSVLQPLLYVESVWISPTKSTCKEQFLSLEDGDNDVTEVVLVFEQLLYDVCEVFGWFV